MRFVRMLVLIAALGLVLAPTGSAIRFTDDSYLVPEGVVGLEYSHQFVGEGGCGPALPYRFRVLSGSVPPGLWLGEDGHLVGIPTQAGSWSFWLELSDEDPPSELWCAPRKSERLFTVNVSRALAVTTDSLAVATVGTPYSVALRADGGGTLTWSIASGELPQGLALDPSSGTITGSPTAAGVYDFRVRMRDDSRSATRQYTLTVRQPLAVQMPAVPRSEVCLPIAVLKLVATGGSGKNTWTVEGALPRGLSLDARAGTITGTPMAAGSFPVELVVKDSETRTASVELTIVVSRRLTIVRTEVAAARTGRRYRARITTRGGVEPTRFRLLSGRLPQGIRLDPTTGVLTGVPSTAGTYRVEIEAYDAIAATARRTVVLDVRDTLA